jgi:phosphoglycerol transferase
MINRLKSITPTTMVLLVGAFVLLFLIIRNTGLYPSVFSDEWIYSEYSRLLPRSEASVPSYLFFFVFGTTRFFGQGFLECARVYNACFFSIAVIFIYAVGRIYGSHKLALFIATLSVLGPINTYSAYFMPESMYFCAFWILTWFVLRHVGKSPWIIGAGTGSILGCMAMIKFHAVFLLPGFFLFILLVWFSRTVYFTVRSLLLTLCLTALAFIVIRFVGGYLLAGPAGLQLVGERYGSFTAASKNPIHLLNLLALSWHAIIGHLFALSFLLPVPLAAMIDIDCKIRSADQTISVCRLLRLLAVSFLLPLIFITAISTAMFANASPYDTIARLHLRYYNFIFPLFFVLAVCELGPGSERSHSPRRIVIALIVGLTSLSAILVGLKYYTPNIVDSPELSVVYNPQFFLAGGALGIISVLIWSVEKKIGTILYLFIFLPLITIGATQRASHDLTSRRQANSYDDAGRVARQLLGRQTSKLTVVGSELIGLYETLFNVDNSETSILEVPPGAPLELSKIPPAKNWVLVVGDHEPLSPSRYRISLGTSSLINFSADNVIDFRDNSWLGILEKITGISTAEEFGRWTIGKEVIMEFVSPLPEKFTLVLRGRAIGPNIDLPFRMKIGAQEQQFRLGSTLQDVALAFETNGANKIVKLEIPKPISPRELWNAPDERLLGAAVEQISISEVK